MLDVPELLIIGDAQLVDLRVGVVNVLVVDAHLAAELAVAKLELLVGFVFLLQFLGGVVKLLFEDEGGERLGL